MKIKLSDIVTLDFESRYSKDYSLTKKQYNTSAYIRDPQFYAQMIGIRDGTKKARWYPHQEIPEVLHKLRVNERPMLAHNAAFDGFILSEIYGIVPPFYLDTLSMSRALHGSLGRLDLDTVSKLYGRGGKVKPHALKKVKGLRELPPELEALLGDYCCGDTDECFEVAKVQLKVFPTRELELIDWTIRAFCDPVLEIDRKLVQQEYDDEVNGKAMKQRVAGVPPELLLSNDKFAVELERLGVTPPMKISNATGELTYAFAKNDLGFQALLEHEDDRVVALVEARLGTKSTQGETRALRFLNMGGKLPAGYNYCGAHTTRWSGSNKINLQNLPRQGFLPSGKIDEATGRLRRAIRAPKGHVLVVCDSAQIEARVNAWLSDQLDVLDLFASGEDVYKHMASAIYGKPIDEIAKLERFIGKIAVLGLGYGMGWAKFQNTLAIGTMGPAVEIDDMEAKRVVNMYRRQNHMIKGMWDRCEDILKMMVLGQPGTYKCLEWDEESVWLPNGLGLHYHGITGSETAHGKLGNFKYFVRGKPSHIYGGLFDENLVQALARVIVGDQLLDIKHHLAKMVPERKSDSVYSRVVMMTHDESVACVPRAAAKDVLAMMIETMSTPPAWAPTIPLGADGGFAANYSK